MRLERWDAVAELFTYPEARVRERLLAACMTLRTDAEFPQEAVERIAEFLEGSEPDALEEHFTRTFDINPLCTLEIGWHLYGEDYARGAFLVELRQTMRALGVEEGSELPDHLPSVLRMLGRLAEPKAEVFSQSFLQPAMLKMIDGYEETDAPYRHLLAGVLAALEVDFGETNPEAVQTPATQAVPYDCGSSCSSFGPPASAFPDLPEFKGGR